MQTDRYSRLVSWLKVLFPLMALAVLSTLFLLSRTLDTDAVIPFADTEIQERLRDQQITGPFFSGTSANGDMISFSAKKLTTPLGSPGANLAEVVRAEIELSSGTKVTMDAKTASYNMANDRVVLSGDVIIATSTGYRMTTARLVSVMSALNVTATGKVVATGPLGELTAGSMSLGTPENAAGAQLVFNKGVKLIYDPKQSKE